MILLVAALLAGGDIGSVILSWRSAGAVLLCCWSAVTNMPSGASVPLNRALDRRKQQHHHTGPLHPSAAPLIHRSSTSIALLVQDLARGVPWA